MSITTSSRSNTGVRQPRDIAILNYDVHTADGKQLEVTEVRKPNGITVVTHAELLGFRWSYLSPVGRAATLQTIRTEVDIVRYSKMHGEPYDVTEEDKEIDRQKNAVPRKRGKHVVGS